ncbi:MAG TPA: hypothetical protein VEK07_16510 [Polyangiaceae bacterium]|nr:hypothetical protein [Polyangiaceae bacterium]
MRRSSPDATTTRCTPGPVVEQATGYPGFNTIIEKDTATLGTVLKENG